VEQCPKCKGPLTQRSERPFPVILQTVFGLSFLVFLFAIEKLRAHTMWLWIWSGFQAVLGSLLIRARVHSSRRVYRCNRCDSALP
jgi:hypothetical protein